MISSNFPPIDRRQSTTNFVVQSDVGLMVSDTCTAIPLASVPNDAADGQVFGTHCVLVSEMWIKEAGIFSSRLATYEKTDEISTKTLKWLWICAESWYLLNFGVYALTHFRPTVAH